jgi:hypothetical protein
MLLTIVLLVCGAAILYFALSVRTALRRSAEDAERLRDSYRKWSERLERNARGERSPESDDTLPR